MALDFDHLLGPHTGKRTDYLSIREIDPLVAAALAAMTQTRFIVRAHNPETAQAPQGTSYQHLPDHEAMLVLWRISSGHRSCSRTYIIAPTSPLR